MYHHKGIGLAAIQVGIPKKIIVLDVLQKDEKNNPLCFINPGLKLICSKFFCITFYKIKVKINKMKNIIIKKIMTEDCKEIFIIWCGCCESNQKRMAHEEVLCKLHFITIASIELWIFHVVKFFDPHDKFHH